MGIIYVLLATLLSALNTFLSKVMTVRSSAPMNAALIFHFSAGLLYLPLLLLESPHWQPSPISLILLLLATFFYAIFNILAFKSNSYLDISVSGILSQTTSVFTFFAALILFHESATVAKIVGITLIILGNVILLARQTGQHINARGAIFRVASAIAFGIGLMIDGFNSVYFTTALFGMVTFLTGGVWILLLAKPNLRDTWADFQTNAKGFLIMAGCATLSYFFLLKSYALVDKSIAVPVYSSTAVLVVLMGIIFLKETTNLHKKLLVITIVFAGLVSLGLA